MDLIKWITEQQAAELIDRSPRTLRKWRTRGEVTAYRQAGIKGLVLYDTHSLQECAATQAMRLRENVGRPPS